MLQQQSDLAGSLIYGSVSVECGIVLYDGCLPVNGINNQSHYVDVIYYYACICVLLAMCDIKQVLIIYCFFYFH